MMAAGTAARNNQGGQTVILERNPRPGRKLMITGKGRCNITNNCGVSTLIGQTATNPRFLYAAFSAFDSSDTMAFFEGEGVPLKTERGGRVFPASNKSSDICDAMVRFCRRAGVGFVQDKAVEIVTENGAVAAVRGEKSTYPCDGCILAAGGASYPATGSDGSGYRLAAALGHTVVPPKPSLVPLVIEEPDPGRMQGLSLRNAAIKIVDGGGKKVYEDFGEMLFTHFGVSGPIILSASSHMKSDKAYRLSINLKPALTPEQLDARILRDFAEGRNKELPGVLRKLLPSSMVSVIIDRWGLPPGARVNAVTREQRLELVRLLRDYSLTIAGFRPIDEAIVTSGGVSVKEIEPGTMASKLIAGLSFAGEIIDVDAHTGGFNLQIALSTGFLAGKEIIK